MASSSTRSLLLISAATLLAVACSSGAPGPRIDSVSPSSARNTAAVQLSIAGKNFYRKVVPDAGNPSNSTAADVRVVFSNATTSFAVALSSSMSVTLLSGTVDAGHAVGAYDVTVFADGGSYTAHDGFTFSGPPVALAFSSATEAVPGTADVVTLNATLRDAAGNATSPDAPVACSLAAPTAIAASLPASISIGVSQTGASFDITDPSVETFAVGCSNTASLASFVLSTGTAAFIAGPPLAAKVLNASEAGPPFTSNTVSGIVLIVDLDGNPVPTHATTFHISWGVLQTGGGPCSASIAPASATVVDGTSFGAATLSGPLCTNGTFQITPVVAEGLVSSSGIFTFVP